MLSASWVKMFEVNILILSFTKTQTIFGIKEQIGWALQKHFWGKPNFSFTNSNQFLKEKGKATQPWLQVICDLALFKTNESLVLTDSTSWSPNVPKSSLCLLSLKKKKIKQAKKTQTKTNQQTRENGKRKKEGFSFSSPFPLQTNPSCIWTSWHCVCPWVCSKARQSAPFSLHGLSYQPRKDLGFRCGSVPGVTGHSPFTEHRGRGTKHIWFTDLSLSQALGNHVLTCWSSQTSKQPLAPDDGSRGTTLYLTGWLRDNIWFDHWMLE